MPNFCTTSLSPSPFNRFIFRGSNLHLLCSQDSATEMSIFTSKVVAHLLYSYQVLWSVDPKLFSTGTDPDPTLQRVSADLTLICFATDVNPDTKLNNLSPFPFLQFLLWSLHSLLLILVSLYIFSSLSTF